tara:strand:+ start:14692 stop:14976 length:285 start_codon:yes stop_codon:yes gene_type:complete
MGVFNSTNREETMAVSEVMKDLGYRIKEERNKQALTQRQLAKSVFGDTEMHSYIYLIENGKKEITFRTLEKFCNALNLKAEINIQEIVEEVKED